MVWLERNRSPDMSEVFFTPNRIKANVRSSVVSVWGDFCLTRSSSFSKALNSSTNVGYSSKNALSKRWRNVLASSSEMRVDEMFCNKSCTWLALILRLTNVWYLPILSMYLAHKSIKIEARLSRRLLVSSNFRFNPFNCSFKQTWCWLLSASCSLRYDNWRLLSANSCLRKASFLFCR